MRWLVFAIATPGNVDVLERREATRSESSHRSLPGIGIL
jgi:hypothetical protein